MAKMQMMKRFSVLLLLALPPVFANAANQNPNNNVFNYNYVEGGFVSIGSGTGNPYAGIGSLSGLGADASYQIAPYFHVIAGFNTVSCCSYHLNNFNVGIGYHQMLMQQLGLFVDAQLVHTSTRYSPTGFSSSSSDTGLGLVGGVRFIPVDKVEVDGFVSITAGNNYVDSSPAPGVRGLYNFAPQWNVFASYTANTDVFFTGLRYDF